MTEEFELTYLAKELPPGFSTNLRCKEVLDIYVPASAEHLTLRIRKCGEVYEMTKKEPVSDGDSSHQIENTIPLTKEEYADLAAVQGKRVRKVRYYYEEDGVTYEIDVFQDALQGLVLVGVEFRSNEDRTCAFGEFLCRLRRKPAHNMLDIARRYCSLASRTSSKCASPRRKSRFCATHMARCRRDGGEICSRRDALRKGVWGYRARVGAVWVYGDCGSGAC